MVTDASQGAGSGYRVFICYRRSDAQDAAGRLALELTRHGPLHEDEIFVDTESLTLGENWKEKIHNTIVNLHALIAVISPDWTKPEADGKLRIRQRDDPVRVELETALEAGIPIWPVLVNGGRMPEAKDLPQKLRDLPDRQALELRHERYSKDVESLVEKLQALSPGPTPAVEPALRTPRPTLRETTRPSTPTLPRPTLQGPSLRYQEQFGLRPIGAWSEEEREAWFEQARERHRVEEAAKAERRDSLPKFYQRLSWYIALPITIAASIAGAFLAENILNWAAGLFGLTQLSSVAAPALVIYGLVWAATYVAVATAYYANDPGRGVLGFYDRGILGGWALAIGDDEEGGWGAAWPLNMLVEWNLARLAAMGLDTWLNVDQIGFFILFVAIITIWAIGNYLLNVSDAI